MTAHHSVISRDGTTIAYERAGSGPALVLVEAAGHFRGFSSFSALAELLAVDFTVYRYDRRGRGDSGDTPPYAVDREVEDIAALVDAAGGTASLYGFSSGALLVLHAAARGVAIPRLAVLEPPIREDESTAAGDFTRELAALVDAGRDADAVEHFHAGIGVPGEMMAELRRTPGWSAMVAIARTLVYDSMLGDASPPSLLARVSTPTLVLDSEGSSDDITGMAATVAAGLAHGTHRSLAGQWHGVPDEDLAPVLADFLSR
jgi:pimeloyl-ACP methyl ester carboxylesterase